MSQRAVQELLRSLKIKEVRVFAKWEDKARLHALSYPTAPALKKQQYDVGCCQELLKLGQVVHNVLHYGKLQPAS